MALQLINYPPSQPNTNPGKLDALLSGIASQDSEALAALYRETSAPIYAFALSILKNTHDAEDVLHDTYLNVFSAASGYHSSGKPMAWILTITRNLCLQKLRDQKKTADIPQEDWEPYLQDQRTLSLEDRLILRACMHQLSDEERQIVVLHAVAGFKHHEIAKALQLPLSTVLSKYSRALKKLKTDLSKGGQT